MILLFKNLISNAIKFNDKANPIIDIGFKEVDGKEVFFVKDNGIGIPKEFQGKILQLFQRLSKKEPGTGIGLAICKNIVEKYNGEIWIESDKGKPTTVFFTLPDCLEDDFALSENRASIISA